MKRHWILAAALTPVIIGFAIIGATTSFGMEGSEKKSKTDAQKVKWYTFDQGVNAAKKEMKLLVVDFYTDWCHWCKVMDKETFANKEVVDFAKANVIMAKIDAETNDKFAYRDAQYSGRQLSQIFGVRGFPTTVFIDSNGDLITTVSGYIPADRFTLILKYLAGNWYEKMKFDEFVKKEETKSKS
jgi:thioredoxin-related protein